MISSLFLLLSSESPRTAIPWAFGFYIYKINRVYFLTCDRTYIHESVSNCHFSKGWFCAYIHALCLFKNLAETGMIEL